MPTPRRPPTACPKVLELFQQADILLCEALDALKEGVSMCLASAYTPQGEKHILIGEDISRIDVYEGRVVLTDFLGRETAVSEVLQSVDLMDNSIFIAPAGRNLILSSALNPVSQTCCTDALPSVRQVHLLRPVTARMGGMGLHPRAQTLRSLGRSTLASGKRAEIIISPPGLVFPLWMPVSSNYKVKEMGENGEKLTKTSGYPDRAGDTVGAYRLRLSSGGSQETPPVFAVRTIIDCTGREVEVPRRGKGPSSRWAIPRA